jgi:hypothetical protein
VFLRRFSGKREKDQVWPPMNGLRFPSACGGSAGVSSVGERDTKPACRSEVLWTAAAEAIRAHGVFRTAKALRLEYGKLKRMVEGGGCRRDRLRNHWVRISSSACHEVQSSGLKSTPARNTIRFLDNPRLAHYSFGFLANPASHPVRISLLKLRQEQLYR